MRRRAARRRHARADHGAVHRRPARVRTDHGTVRAEVVVRATEALHRLASTGTSERCCPLGNYVDRHRADRRRDVGRRSGSPTASCSRIAVNMVAYGQRTADGRIVWGGLSGPSWWQSRVPPSPMADRRVASVASAQTLRAACSRRCGTSLSPTTGAASLGVATRPARRASATTAPPGSRMGRRLLRPGRRVRERRRPHARRPRLRRRQRDGPAAVGRTPVAALGARAPALARRARRGRDGARTRLDRHPPILIRHEGGPRCGSPCRCR